MTLTELRYVLALAEERHFSKAAERCHVSQPTLSVAVNKLESRLGVVLFERHNKQLGITDVGERLIIQAKRVLDEVDVFHAIAEESTQQLNSPLKLGAVHTIAPYLFPSLVPELTKQAPGMPLLIHEGFTSALQEKLLRGELDAIFVALPFKVPNVVVKSLYEEQFVVLLPKKHRLAKQTVISRQELSKENTLLLGEGHCLRDQIIKTCPQCYSPGALQQTIEGASLETLRHMVASGMGVTILPSTATQVKHHARTLCVRPLDSRRPKRTVALAWRSSFPRAKAIDALISSLRQLNLTLTCPLP